jgi:DNA-binding NarL/FixJ family response regulator
VSGNRRLVFIDDDPAELEAFGEIAGGDYDYTPVHWPAEWPKLLLPTPPEIFVSDLYLPPRGGDSVPAPADREAAAAAASRLAKRFAGLFARPFLDDKERLRETMTAISEAYGMLRLQWTALGQSPGHGIELLRELKTRWPETPFVFYSRKITPEDVIEVLKAGAVDAIRKGALPKEEVLARLAKAQEIHRSEDSRAIRARGFNVNATAVPR